MDFLKVNKILNDFGKYVVQQSKSNLTKDKKGNGALYNSIKYKLDTEKDIFLLDFLMENYGDFVDQGVKGKDPSKVSPNAKIKGQQAPNSQFKFGVKSVKFLGSILLPKLKTYFYLYPFAKIYIKFTLTTFFNKFWN